MMKTLGYYYDQVARERMTQRLSSRTAVFQASTPTSIQLAGNQVVWLQTLHPSDHELAVPVHRRGNRDRPLVYGKLGVPRVVPWDDVPPGYGRHQVEYRAIDASGNIGTPDSFAVTLLPGTDLHQDHHWNAEQPTIVGIWRHLPGRCLGQRSHHGKPRRCARRD
jgi:hypothetical protein